MIARLEALLDSGVVPRLTRNHIPAACTAELARGKRRLGNGHQIANTEQRNGD